MNQIEVEIRGKREGAPLSLGTVDLATLRRFISEVERFVKGDEANADLSDSRVSLEEGSVRLVVGLSLH